jgi:steroid delta-isomerase-like uncharacterized protein
MPQVSEVHREFANAWNKRDFDRIRSLFHAEYTYTGGDGKEMQGGPDVGVSMARMYAAAFPDGSLEVKRVFTQGDTAIAEMIGRGTQKGEFMGVPPPNRRVEISICNVIELRDGKVYREREYMDMLSIMNQLGIALAGHKTRTA